MDFFIPLGCIPLLNIPKWNIDAKLKKSLKLRWLGQGITWSTQTQQLKLKNKGTGPNRISPKPMEQDKKNWTANQWSLFVVGVIMLFTFQGVFHFLVLDEKLPIPATVILSSIGLMLVILLVQKWRSPKTLLSPREKEAHRAARKLQRASLMVLSGLALLTLIVVGIVIVLFAQSLFNGFIGAIVGGSFLWFVYYKVDNGDGPLF